MSQKKLSELDAKIQKLLTEKQQIVNNRSQEIADIIVRMDLSLVDEHVLAGALVSLKEDIQKNSSNIETWRQMGAKFFRGRARSNNKISKLAAA